MCAERIRRSYLDQLRHDGDLRVELLHEIAHDIADRCGHSPLKAHRIAWGWTVAEAVAAFHSMCREEGIKPRGLVARSWMEWEAGARPNWDYQDLLSRLFNANPVQLGWAADYAPAECPKPVIPGGTAERGIGMVSIAQRSLAGQSPRAGALLHLPPDTEDFTGRADHVSQVARLITVAANSFDTAVPIAMISGKAGVGKTTLAIHIAHQVGSFFPDGQIYTDLRGAESRATDPADVLAGFLRELGIGLAVIQEKDRTEHAPTKKELADQARYSGTSVPKYDYKPSQRLNFTMARWSEYQQFSWADRVRSQLEEKLPAILQEIEIPVGTIRAATAAITTAATMACARCSRQMRNVMRCLLRCGAARR
jgi:hypothetical protein